MLEVAYRCIVPNAAEIMAEHGEEQRAWFAAAEKAAARALKTRRKIRAVYAQGTGHIRIMGYAAPTEKVKSWSDRMIERPYAPDGWMLREQNRYPGGPAYIVPKRVGKAGKQLYADVKIGEKFTSIMDRFGGMPHRIMVPEAPGRMLSPGWRSAGDTLYVTWSGDPDRDTFGGNSPDRLKVDPAIWERVPLSVYYAAIEKADAA